MVLIRSILLPPTQVFLNLKYCTIRNIIVLFDDRNRSSGTHNRRYVRRSLALRSLLRSYEYVVHIHNTVRRIHRSLLMFIREHRKRSTTTVRWRKSVGFINCPSAMDASTPSHCPGKPLNPNAVRECEWGVGLSKPRSYTHLAIISLSGKLGETSPPSSTNK